jgi:hypothetical protein
VADRLTLARALEGGGIGRDPAEHIATEIIDVIHENVATKSDLQATETALGTELRSGVATLRVDLRSEVAALCADFALVEHRLLTRLGSMVVVATGILVAIHYIH